MRLCEKIDNVRDRLRRTYGVTAIAHYPLRVWTRGDGVRYKEPSYMESTEDIFGCLEEMFPNARRIKVRGEFGSDPYDDALVHNQVVYIKRVHNQVVYNKRASNRGNVVTFATTSILKNTDVWNTK